MRPVSQTRVMLCSKLKGQNDSFIVNLLQQGSSHVHPCFARARNKTKKTAAKAAVFRKSVLECLVISLRAIVSALLARSGQVQPGGGWLLIRSEIPVGLVPSREWRRGSSGQRGNPSWETYQYLLDQLVCSTKSLAREKLTRAGSLAWSLSITRATLTDNCSVAR